MTKEFACTVENAADLKALQGSLNGGGGAFVAAHQLPALFEEVSVCLSIGDVEHTAVGTVVNLPSGSGGFYVHFQDAAVISELLKSVEAFLQGIQEKDSNEATVAHGETAPDAQEEPNDGEGRERATPAWDLIDPTSSEPIHAQVRKLSLAEKLKVARTATRPVRELLIRASEKRIHAEVLRNPKVTDDEIMQYTAMPNLSPRVLDWVSNQPKHMRRRAVMLNVVQNPMTPPDTAKKLLSRLNDHELLRITRSSKVREVVSRAAKKILMRKGVL